MTSPMPWIKVYTEILDDHKFGLMPRELRWSFIEMCLIAGECDAEGYLVQSDEPMDVETIAWRLRRFNAEVADDLKALEQRGFMAFDDGVWLIKNFAKRQGRPQHEKRAEWRERKRRERERPEQQAEPEVSETAVEVTEESRVTPEGVLVLEKRREEKSRSESLPIGRTSSTGDDTSPKNGLSPGQRAWLEAFGAKRFKTMAQKDAVFAMETKYPADFRDAMMWAAKQGMTMGAAVVRVETALKNWGKGKSDVLTVAGL